MGLTSLKLTITISKTSDGKRDYLQIMSDDAFSVNVVFVAEKIVVKDVRK